MRDLAWPREQLGAALASLGHESGLAAFGSDVLVAPAWLARANDRALTLWVEAAAASLGMEAEGTEVTHGEAARVLRSGGPALLRVQAEEGDRYLALVGRSRGRVRFVTPAHVVRSMKLDAARALLVSDLEEPLGSDVDRWLEEVAMPRARRARARSALLAARLGSETIAHAWSLRLPLGAGFVRQLARAGLVRRFGVMASAYAAQYVLFLASWWVVGRAALEGSLDRGWLAAWGLLLMTIVPLRALLTWSQGMFAVAAGGLLKQRLLHGATRLEAEEVRHEGAGRMLGRVIESEAVESLALSGGVHGLMAAFEMVLALAVLAVGAGGVLHVTVAVAWLGSALWLAARYLRRRRAWTNTRMQLTNDLVERMVGHRTRLAQERRSRWHDGEDQTLESYVQHARDMDTSAARFVTLIPRGWLLIALLALAPAIVTGQASTIGIAVALGGVLLAHQAFEKLVMGASDLADARIAWQQVAPLFAAAARAEAQGEPAFACVASNGQADQDAATPLAESVGAATPARVAPVPAPNAAPLVDASELVFGHEGRAEPVLRGLHLRLGAGERVLLEGPSGSGKSTLAALLAGLRVPDSGLILLDGLDRHTLGSAGWHRRVAMAPQFHENHVLTGTLAFNLLMGRRWPAPPEDLGEAEAVCRDLGLGELIDRMPSGMLQMVGESGWQLSHGERSRLYMARALLQGAELVVLDESFAALDPETLELSVRCALRRAPALLVIAHP